MAQNFGGSHTKTKLDAVQTYLEIYTTALKKQKFDLVYFDAFAGTGSIETRIKIAVQNEGSSVTDLLGDSYEGVEALDPLIEGSARRALGITNSFDRYVFVEKDKSKANELESVKLAFPELADRIEIINDDANVQIASFCASTDWRKTRAVAFLDPYGSQVSFESIALLAGTRAVDVWYLFPAFLSVYRQISSDGRMTSEQENSIIRLLGTDDWRKKWIKREVSNDLLGPLVVDSKQVDVDEITRYMIARMRAVFRGVVLDSWLPLGQDNSHWYSLLFACANPKPNATAKAAKFASYVMTRK